MQVRTHAIRARGALAGFSSCLALLLAGGLLVSPVARADCLPANPGGAVVVEADDGSTASSAQASADTFYRGDRVLLRLLPNQDETAYVDASSVYFDVSGPAGPTQLPDPAFPAAARYTIPSPGSYTVTGHWTERCEDESGPATRSVTSARLTFNALAPGPPGIVVGSGRGAKSFAVVVRVMCPDQAAHAVDEPLTVSAAVDSTRPKRAHRAARWTEPHGCRRQIDGGRRIELFVLRRRRTIPFLPPRLVREDFATAYLYNGGINASGIRPGRGTMAFQIKSGSRAIASVSARFYPQGRGEGGRVLSAACPLMPTGCIRSRGR